MPSIVWVIAGCLLVLWFVLGEGKFFDKLTLCLVIVGLYVAYRFLGGASINDFTPTFFQNLLK